MKSKDQETVPYPSTKDLLRYVAGAGALGLILAFPPIITGVAAIVKLGSGKYKPWGVRRQINRLERQNYITKRVFADGRVEIKLNKKGVKRSLTYDLYTMTIPKQKKWDGKWRMAIFDVPETRRQLRERFRKSVMRLGLYQLQKSVYISPYPCADQIEFLRQLFDMAIDVKYFTVEKLEDDMQIRYFFNLA